MTKGSLFVEVMKETQTIYIVTSNLINCVKVGIWSSSNKQLFDRYYTYYGPETELITFTCPKAKREVEKDFLLHFYRDKVGTELFNKEKFEEYVAYLSDRTGVTEKLYTHKRRQLYGLEICRNSIASWIEKNDENGNGIKEFYDKNKGSKETCKLLMNLLSETRDIENDVTREKKKHIIEICKILEMKNSVQVGTEVTNKKLERFIEYMRKNPQMERLFRIRGEWEFSMGRGLTVLKRVLENWNGTTILKEIERVKRKAYTGQIYKCHVTVKNKNRKLIELFNRESPR